MTVPRDEDAEASLVRGCEHSWARRWTVYQLGAALGVMALFALLPAAMDVIEHLRTPDSPGIPRWVFALMLACGLQLAYAVYLFQLPDWSTVWVVSLAMLVLTTVYAMLFGLTTLADDQSLLIRWLELGDKLAGKKAAGWCLILLSLSSLMAYLCGRTSVRWHRAEQH
jgi:hypothetical protein